MNRKIMILLLTGMVLAGIVLTSYQPAAAAVVESTPTATIGKKALLVVSFGTSYADTRAKTIEASEKALAAAFPDYDLKRAFTSQTIINILKNRDGLEIDNAIQAIERIYKEGYSEVLVQPLHVINGAEYHDLIVELNPYNEKFEKFSVGSPLLSSHEDYVAVIKALDKVMPARGEKEAVVFMGHGTHHPADAAYAAMNYVLQDEGYTDVFVGTVEGYPTLDTIIKSLEAAEIEKVTLMPFMIVAGDHAQNDMAGDEESSWKVILKSKGYEVETVLKGLGEMEGIKKIYIEHAKAALEPAEEEEAAE